MGKDALENINNQMKIEEIEQLMDDSVEITYARDGKIYTAKLTYAKSTKVAYKLTKADPENELQKAWLQK